MFLTPLPRPRLSYAGNPLSTPISEVEWCVSNQADHGGVYSYRICQDDTLVAKFIDREYTPNQEEMDALEVRQYNGNG